MGTITALITPFINGEVDEEGLRENLRFQMQSGISAVFPLGSTGETPTLSEDEQQRIINIVVDEVEGEIPVWVGTGSYCTKSTIESTKMAKDLGADAAVIVTPYYNKPTQEGIFRHFEAIATAVDLPIIVYNIQGRCGVNIENSTMLRIAGLPNILAVKEASGNVTQVGNLVQMMKEKYPEMLIYSGDDGMTLPFMAVGANGVISVASNLVPEMVIAQVNAALQGDFIRSREIHYQLLTFYRSLFVETNPVPIKRAMSLCGMAAGECRLPLAPMSEESENILIQGIQSYEQNTGRIIRGHRNGRTAVPDDACRSSLV